MTLVCNKVGKMTSGIQYNAKSGEFTFKKAGDYKAKVRFRHVASHAISTECKLKFVIAEKESDILHGESLFSGHGWVEAEEIVTVGVGETLTFNNVGQETVHVSNAFPIPLISALSQLMGGKKASAVAYATSAHFTVESLSLDAKS
jgi:hypothetical protein